MFPVYSNCCNNILLSRCRQCPGADPIVWLPMARAERSRCIGWRFGWLPGGKPPV
ncbi:hypothetical protein BX666DRAFT_1867073 [Dichotomocladium elegans]|nr:hypothetical protein BX666DRAFT_1867073 [Dichotomocladium elegans]